MQSFKRVDGNFMYSGIFTQVFITFFFQDLHLMYHIRNLHLNTYEFSISILFLIIALRIKPSVFLREKQVWYYEGSPPTVKRWVLALQRYSLPYTYNAFQNLVASDLFCKIPIHVYYRYYTGWFFSQSWYVTLVPYLHSRVPILLLILVVSLGKMSKILFVYLFYPIMSFLNSFIVL